MEKQERYYHEPVYIVFYENLFNVRETQISVDYGVTDKWTMHYKAIWYCKIYNWIIYKNVKFAKSKETEARRRANTKNEITIKSLKIFLKIESWSRNDRKLTNSIISELVKMLSASTLHTIVQGIRNQQVENMLNVQFGKK